MVLDDSVLRRSNALREMMDLARFIVSDGEVSEMEARIFQRWLDKNPDMLGVYPINELVGVLRNIFADGEMSDSEKNELKAILDKVAG